MDQFADKSSVFIDGARQTVWDAITKEEQLSKWYVPGSSWNIPDLKEGENVTFTLMPSEHNNLSEELSMSLTIKKVLPYQELTLFLEAQQMPISFTLEEEKNGTRVTMNSKGFDESLANLKALIEVEEIPYK